MSHCFGTPNGLKETLSLVHSGSTPLYSPLLLSSDAPFLPHVGFMLEYVRAYTGLMMSPLPLPHVTVFNSGDWLLRPEHCMLGENHLIPHTREIGNLARALMEQQHIGEQQRRIYRGVLRVFKRTSPFTLKGQSGWSLFIPPLGWQKVPQSV